MTKNKIYKDVAALHVASIPSGFLPTLGIPFLSLMYRCIDESQSTVLITNYKKNKLAGFVSGSLGEINLYMIMFSHPLKLFFSLLPVLFSLKKIKKIISILSYGSSKQRKKYPNPELLTICVDNDFRRLGVANELYERLSHYFRCNTINKFVIIVGMALDANHFYSKQGATIAGEIEVHKGSLSYVYIQTLP